MKNKNGFIWLIVGSILIWIIITIIIWKWENPINLQTNIDYQAFGTYGDFFGGVIGTIFAIVGVIIVYLTYKGQVEFQKKDQIESRFFELLNLHEKNVDELKFIDRDIFNVYIKNVKNFVSLIKKFNQEKGKNWDNVKVVKLGYLYFFYGPTEYTSERFTGTNIKTSEVKELNDYILKLGIEYKGSYTELGKYYRQLFQIVTYINEKSELNYKEKQQYIKSLRVRLNIEEQYLFFLNSLVSKGLDWELNKDDENEKLITKFNLLKNIQKEDNIIDAIDFRKIYPNVQYEFMGDEKSEERKRLENLYSNKKR